MPKKEEITIIKGTGTYNKFKQNLEYCSVKLKGVINKLKECKDLISIWLC